jgi:predicted translin family RNA/ssDNA-binding protein
MSQSDALFPMTAADVLAKPRAALVRAVDKAEQRCEKAEENLSKAKQELADFDLGLQMQAREHEQALAELRRDLKRAIADGADPETGEVS